MTAKLSNFYTHIIYRTLGWQKVYQGHIRDNSVGKVKEDGIVNQCGSACCFKPNR